MTNEKLTQVLQFYFDKITDKNAPFCGMFIKDFPIVPEQLDDESYGYNYVDTGELARHLAWMCRRCLDAFIPVGPGQDVAKAHRWLGYVQGELRAARVYTINELRNHSRS